MKRKYSDICKKNDLEFNLINSKPKYDSRDPNLCLNCHKYTLGQDNGRSVCYSCGRDFGPLYDGGYDTHGHLLYAPPPHTYKRIFYFNERCCRWLCQEPFIPNDVFFIIEDTYTTWKRKTKREAKSPKDIGEILRSVKLTETFKEKYRSRKFKMTAMSEKRFYDKYYEKWKTILWRLTGKKPNIPPLWLIDRVRDMFLMCQVPFEEFRHDVLCDRRVHCDRYFNCWHNFINYDYLFRKFLQIIEIRYKKDGLYDKYKNDFPLMSKKIRTQKLFPLFKKICIFCNWPIITDE